MKKTIQAILYALPGLILAVGEKTFFSPCVHADGTAASCAPCGQAVFIAGILLAVLGAARCFLPLNAKPWGDLALALGSLCTLLLPLILKTCMMQSMRCNAVMKPAVWLISAAGIILFAAAMAADLHTAKGRKRS